MKKQSSNLYFERFQIIFFFIITITVFVFVSRYTYFMSTTSLWNDEIFTFENFVSNGAFYSWTNYPVPNNHILFSIIASIIPDSYLYDPTISRLWSFVAVWSVFLLIFWFSIHIRAFMSGAIVLSLLGLNINTLDLTLQARGYGLAFFFATMQCISTYMYLKTDSRKWFFSIVISGIFGGAALPVYIPFAALNVLGVLIAKPTRDTILVSASALFVGAAFYAPTANQIVESATRYSDRWGHNYVSLHSVYETSLFLLPSGQWWVIFSIFLCIFIIIFNVLHRSKWLLKFSVVMLVTTGGFIAFCLFLQTPLVRTTQFVVVAPAVLLIACGSLVNIRSRIALWVSSVASVLPIILIIINFNSFFLKPFVPIEAWYEVAQKINRIELDNKSIYAPFRSNQLEVYLEGDVDFTNEFSVTDFKNGDLVVVDSNFRSDQRFSGDSYTELSVDMLIPQRRGGYQVISFVPKDALSINEVDE